MRPIQNAKLGIVNPNHMTKYPPMVPHSAIQHLSLSVIRFTNNNISASKHSDDVV